MNCTEYITYKGFSLRISFDYDKGFKGSQLEPPEPELIEIDLVTLIHTVSPSYDNWNGGTLKIDITELLDNKQFPEIETLLWEKREDWYDR